MAGVFQDLGKADMPLSGLRCSLADGRLWVAGYHSPSRHPVRDTGLGLFLSALAQK